LLRKSVNSTSEAETLRWEMSQGEPERVFQRIEFPKSKQFDKGNKKC
jgi:hypothetical protein